MLRFIAVGLFLIAHAALACDDAQPSLKLRDAIYARDVTAVEHLLDQNQKLFEAGERTAEDTRCLFRHFTKLRPATFDFVDEWLKSHPDSAYALTAKVWINHAVSWQIRGDRYARDTYPEALSEFNELQEIAWDHAEAAYRSQPRLIAASDALIVLANPRGKPGRRDAVLGEVMATDPNEGTLTRAIAQILRGWGGTWDQGAAMCDTYAHLVPNAGPDAATRCKLPLARNFKEQWDWLNETLATGKYPDLDHLRLDFILVSDANRNVADIAYRVMSQEGYDITKHLSEYDSLALKYDLPLLTETISKRRHAKAAREFEHSPFSLDVLKILREPVLTSAKDADGHLALSVLEQPTPEQALDYARRSVQASPYNPDAWEELFTRLAQSGRITNVALSEPYRVNAIVYDNNSAARLSDYLLQKLFEYDAFKRVQAGTMAAEAAAMFDGIDETQDMICPVIRAVRLLDAVCDARHQAECDLDAAMSGAVAVIEETAKTEQVCFKERTLPAHELAFTPMPLPDEG